MIFNKFEKRDKDIVRDKKDILFLKYVVLGLILNFIHAILDYYYGNVAASLIDTGIFIILLIIYSLAYFGNRYLLAKILFLSFVNISLFILASIVPKEEGIYLIFFPFVTTLFTIFDVKQIKLSYLFASLTLALVIILEISDYQVFGDFKLEEEAAEHSFIVNLIVGLMVVIFSVNFLVRINKKAEDHLNENQVHLTQLTHEIQKQNKILARTNTELDRFVYSTSHDLRAPLMSILGLILLAEKDSEESTPVYLDKIKSQVKKLDEFIKDIISYSRNTRVEVKKEEIDIHLMMNEVLDNLKFMDGADKIEFKKSIQLTAPVKSDKSRLSIILNNLISNAIKYHDYDKPNPYVEIDVRTRGSELEISISDNGQGIPPEYQKDIFKMFVRVSEKSHGSGLGLYIVKEMTEKLNGKLFLKSEEGKGSTFTLRIRSR